MEKKEKLGAFVSSVGKAAKGIVNTAVQSADQNDDGKFDLADVSAIANTVGAAVKKGTQSVKNSADEKTRLLELKTLRPIFATQHENAASLDDADFLMPKFIRIANRDKKHSESEVCQGSIGFASDQKGLYYVNLFRDSLNSFGLKFYPDSDSEFYYMDPSDRDTYIALDEYFSYLRIARVNELKKLAQDLGAKYFRVTFMEEKTSFSSNKTTTGIKAVGSKADINHSSEKKEYSNIRIEAETHFPGHPPVKPQLKYLQRDESIQTLISMRMDATSPLMHEKYMLQLSQSSGMKENDAVKIDAVLKSMKFSGNATVSSEAKNEARRYLEYEIEF